jgi:hypothetical protein
MSASKPPQKLTVKQQQVKDIEAAQKDISPSVASTKSPVSLSPHSIGESSPRSSASPTAYSSFRPKSLDPSLETAIPNPQYTPPDRLFSGGTPPGLGSPILVTKSKSPTNPPPEATSMAAKKRT